MRKLIILRGAMGVGKSTFIKENDLENYTLSADNIRLMFSSPQININYKEEIPQFNNKKVWNLLYYILEERMKKGEFTIVDASHLNCSESFPIYKKLAEKYRYRLYVLDFTDIPKEEVYLRNKTRIDYKIVPEHIIDRAYKMISKEKVPSAFKVIKPSDFKSIFNTTPKNMDSYEAIHIIGDIHGCYSALKEYFNEFGIKSEDAYIFLGDYFDRGIENNDTFKYLEQLMSNENMTFLIGNHEDKLYKYACDDEFKLDYDIKNTIHDFEEKNISKSQVRGFIKRLAQISYITFGKKDYIVTHAGMPFLPKKSLDFYSTNSILYGNDDFEADIDKIYDDFMEKEETKVIQIHGHRNYHKIKADAYEYSFNLEGDIEHGGNLRVLTLYKDGTYQIDEVKNEVFNSNLAEETDVFNLIQDLRKNRYIFEKHLRDNIFSYNFSKEAFHNKIWNSITTQARGLFIDVNNNKIVARSYNKFFNINERRETEIDFLKTKFVFPVKFYLKYNGFLGILSVYNNELFFASKSTDIGDHVDNFKSIFYKKYNREQIETIKNKIIDCNVSFIFEVIDPVNDPHIIEYEEPNIVLLDMVKNTTNFNKISYGELKTFADKNSLFVKELVYEAKNSEELTCIFDKITSSNYRLNSEYIEGFVIEDSLNTMVKIKTDYYMRWKNLRAKMEQALKNRNFKTKYKTGLEDEFMSFIKNKYENIDYDIQKIDIIKERSEFDIRKKDE